MKKIVFLVGESGSGKTYLQENLIKYHPKEFCRIISTTTRPIREGEVDKLHYHFIKKGAFQYLMDADQLLQYVEFGGEYYGTQMNEYTQKQDIGTFVCTPEGIDDTIEALEKVGIVYEYEIVFFMTTNDLLKKHNVDQARIDRGNIRLDFIERFYKNQFKNIRTTILFDSHINDNLPFTIAEML